MRGKPKAAVTPPAPKPMPEAAIPPPPKQALSSPQTDVKLPPPQPLNPEALVTAPVEPPPEVQAAPRPARRPQPAPAPPRVEAQVQAPAATPEPERPPIQPILPADQQRRFQESAQGRRAEVRRVLAQMQASRLSSKERDVVKYIESFLAQSDQAEQRGDMGAADAFAERAQTLARSWQSGR